MDFDYTPDEQSFRQEVRSFIAENLPPKEQRGKNFLGTWLEKYEPRAGSVSPGPKNSAAAMAG